MPRPPYSVTYLTFHISVLHQLVCAFGVLGNCLSNCFGHWSLESSRLVPTDQPTAYTQQLSTTFAFHSTGSSFWVLGSEAACQQFTEYGLFTQQQPTCIFMVHTMILQVLIFMVHTMILQVTCKCQDAISCVHCWLIVAWISIRCVICLLKSGTIT